MTPDERLAPLRASRRRGRRATSSRGSSCAISAHPEHLPFARAIAEVAYEIGAKYVEVIYPDPHVRRSRIRHAPEDTLDWSPPWTLALIDELASDERRPDRDHRRPRARALRATSTRRGSRKTRPRLARGAHAAARRATGASPGRSSATRTPAGRRRSSASPTSSGSGRRSRSATRLDEDDPVAAWRDAHREAAGARASMLNERRFDAIRFRGPGTDLTVGLMPRVALAARAPRRPSIGVEEVVNMPTEEVFTSPAPAPHRGRRALDDAARRERPDRARPHGALRGRARDRGDRRRTAPTSSARRCAPTTARSFLGEVALVDGDSRVGKTGIIFFDTLFDENAACHIAYGEGFTKCVAGHEERRREAARSSSAATTRSCTPTS